MAEKDTKTKILIIYFHEVGWDQRKFEDFLANKSPTFKTRIDRDNIKIVWPGDKHIPFTAAGGAPLAAWYDQAFGWEQNKFLPDTDGSGEDERNVIDTLNNLDIYLHTIAPSYPNVDHIFIGGFSQGGNIALHALGHIEIFQQHFNNKIRGVFTMGTLATPYSHIYENLKNLIKHNETISMVKQFPLEMMHGDDDDIVQVGLAKQAIDNFSQIGLDCHFQGFPKVKHEITEGMLTHLLNFVEDFSTNNTDSNALVLPGANKPQINNVIRRRRAPEFQLPGCAPPVPALLPKYEPTREHVLGAPNGLTNPPPMITSPPGTPGRNHPILHLPTQHSGHTGPLDQGDHTWFENLFKFTEKIQA